MPWLRYFEYVSCSQLIWYQLMSLTPLFSFSWSIWPWSIVQWEITSNFKLHKTISDISSHSTIFIYYIKFRSSVCIFIFLEIINQNMFKMLQFSSIFSIKVAAQNSPSWITGACVYHVADVVIVESSTKQYPLKWNVQKPLQQYTCC